jgi:hypothetical protein
MKKYCYFVGLLVIHPLISASCSSLTLIAKDHSPPLEQAKHTQAVIPAIQSTPENKPNLSARFYATEKTRRISGWQLEDFALLKMIKDGATRLWGNHYPDKNIIRLESWNQDT